MAWTFVDKINLVTAIQRHGENWAAIASVLKLASGLAASGRVRLPFLFFIIHTIVTVG